MGKKSKCKCPAHIAEHVRSRGEGHHYVSYYDGAVHYDLPYWTFVHLAKEAGATVELHKSAIADTNTVDQYLDEHCLVPADKIKEKESEIEMKRRLQDIEKIRKMVESGSKKWVRYEEGAELYSIGVHSFRKIAKDAKAIYKVGNIVLIDTQKIDKFIEAFQLEDEEDF